MPELTDDQLKESLQQIFGEMSEDELQALVDDFEEEEQKLIVRGPQNPDELHQYIQDEIGVDIPRTSVCEDHDAPFHFLADLFFEDEMEWTEPDGTKRVYGGVGSSLLMASRGGGKTFLVALLHFLNSSFKPGCESLTFGATEYQSKRCYDHLKPWVTEVREVAGELKKRNKHGVEISQRSETRWQTGSKVEIVSGTPEAVNGPHPNIAHADEAEQMREDTWDESRNMAIAGKTTDGRLIKPKNIVTSTRKSLFGRMQSLINEVRKAEEDGMRPPYKLYQFCIFETAAQVKNCRQAPENAGRPDEELCECNKIPKGTWDNGTVRTLETVCGGRFFKSRGYQPKIQIDELFSQNIKPVWEAQQECRRPETQNNYVAWDEWFHQIRDYDPHPDYGKIYIGIDWGAGNPNAINFYQVLNQDLEVTGWDNEWKIIPAGSWVCFDEIYIAEIGATKLAEKLIKQEMKWKKIHPGWKVEARFADVQGRQQRHDFLDKGLKTTWNATRDFEYHVELVQDLFEEAQFYADAEACPMFCQEIQVWRRNPQTGKQVDEFNHAMSNFRYVVANIHRRMQRLAKRGGAARSSREATAAAKKNKLKAVGPVGLAGQEISKVVSEFG